MAGETGLVHEVWQAFEASPLGQTLLWGGVGGLVAWWSVEDKDKRGALKKQIILGAIVAGGTGTTGAAMINIALGAEYIAAASAAIGPVAFLMGVFGPAYITMKLRGFNRAGQIEDTPSCEIRPDEGSQDADG